MTEQTEADEEEILTLTIGGSRANESLLRWMMSQKEGRLCFLTDNFYSVSELEGSQLVGCGLINRGAQGQAYPNGIDKFVKAYVRNPRYSGLVPLTEGAKAVVEKYKLSIVAVGDNLNPENIRYDIYGKTV